MKRFLLVIALLILSLPVKGATLYKWCNFGTTSATVGYTLYDSTGTSVTSRTTSGVSALAGGIYAATVTIPTTGTAPYEIVWDTGGSSPVYGIDIVAATASGTVNANVVSINSQTASATGTVNFDQIATINTNAATAASESTSAANLGTSNAAAISTINTTVNTINSQTSAANQQSNAATGVLGATASSWNTSGTIGNKINSAGSAGDPWATVLPGSYTTGQAGYIVGTNINATISSRSTYAGGDTSGTTTLLTRLPQILLFDGSGFVKADTQVNSDKTGYSLAITPPTSAQIAAAILKTPSNLLATDSNGDVTFNNTTIGVSGNVTVGAYASNESPDYLVWNALLASYDTASTFGNFVQNLGGSSLTAAQVWAYSSRTLSTAPPTTNQIAASILSNPSNLLATDSSGRVTPIPTTSIGGH